MWADAMGRTSCSPQLVVFARGLSHGHSQRAFLVTVETLVRTYGREPAIGGDSDVHSDNLLSFSLIFAFL